MKETYRDKVLLIIVMIMLFQSNIQEYFKVAKYFDEFFVVWGFLYILYYNKFKIEKRVFNLLLLILIYIVWGIICNAFGIITSWGSVLQDIGTQIKFPVTMIFFYLYFRKNNVTQTIFIKCANILSVFVVVAFSYWIVNFFQPISGMIYEYRYGLPAFQFIFGHPGTLNIYSMFWLVFFSIAYAKTKKRFYSLIIFGDLLLMISTLRTRAFACALIYIILVIYYYFPRYKLKRVIMFGTIFVCCFLVGYGTFEDYFFNQNTPRSLFFRYGIQIMQEKMPLGYGFATYGSNAAASNYSPLYLTYGFNLRYGLSYDNNLFLTDNYWPMVMGQFGLIGLLLTIIIIKNVLFIAIGQLSKINEYQKVVVVLLLFVLIINSISSSSFSHFTAVAYSMLINMVIFEKKCVLERT